MTNTAEQLTSIDHRIGARGRFTLRQASGEIVLRGVEGDRVRVRSLDERKVLSDQFEIDRGDGYLELRQLDRIALGILRFRGFQPPDIEVEVPHGATVAVEAASADIEASDLSGPKQFRTASGDVVLRRLAGPLEVQTVSGDVELEGQAPVDLVARSVSGDIHVRVPRLRRMEIGTTSGDLVLDADLAGEGPFALRSISGDARIVARGGFRVEAETITGELSSELPAKRESMLGRKVLTIGRPGATLAFRSVSGDLEVVQPRNAAPEAVATPIAPEEGAAPTAPVAPAPPAIPPVPMPKAPADAAIDVDAARLEILRELERGEISVAEATDRLGRLDEVLR